MIWHFLRWGIGLVFLLAGALKAWDPQSFAYAIENYQLTRWSVSIGIAFYLPWLEMIAGAALLTGWLYRGALATLGLLTVIFLGALSSAWARGLNIECGCFQSESSPTGLGTSLGIDLLILGSLLALAWNEARFPLTKKTGSHTLLFLTVASWIHQSEPAHGSPPLHPSPPLSLAQAQAQPGLKFSWATDGRTRISVSLENSRPTACSVEIPAGLVCVTESGARVWGVQARVLESVGTGKTTATLSALALSTKNAGGDGPCVATQEKLPRLESLLRRLCDAPPLPRQTAQLAAFALLENLSLADWQTFLGLPSFSGAQTPPENDRVFLTECVDALAVLQTLAPGERFAFAADPDLKRRILRQPALRLRALSLYGIETPSDLPEAPDINRLLHKQPGDNCPACQNRARSFSPQNAP
jgi:putative oxidoreductase